MTNPLVECLAFTFSDHIGGHESSSIFYFYVTHVKILYTSSKFRELDKKVDKALLAIYRYYSLPKVDYSGS